MWRSWVALWDRREAPTGLALVRIFLGACIVVDLVTVWRLGLVTPLYSTDGYAVAYDGWARSILGADPGPVLFGIALAAGACLLLGAGTRVACVVYAIVAAQLAYHAPDADRGSDMIMRVIALVLAFSQCNARWSIDALVWRRLGKAVPTVVSAWPRYLLLLQLVWIYFSGGINKSAAEWGPLGGFAAIENIVTDPHMARFEPGWIASVIPLARIGTAVTIVFELIAPVYVLALYYAETADRPGRIRRAVNRLRVRWLWIGAGIALHLGIAVTMRLGMFPFVMLALYPVLLRPCELGRLGRSAERA